MFSFCACPLRLLFFHLRRSHSNGLLCTRVNYSSKYEMRLWQRNEKSRISEKPSKSSVGSANCSPFDWYKWKWKTFSALEICLFVVLVDRIDISKVKLSFWLTFFFFEFSLLFCIHKRRFKRQSTQKWNGKTMKRRRQAKCHIIHLIFCGIVATDKQQTLEYVHVTSLWFHGNNRKTSENIFSNFTFFPIGFIRNHFNISFVQQFRKK